MTSQEKYLNLRSCQCNEEDRKVMNIGRIQFFNESKNKFMDWEKLLFCPNCNEKNELTISLHRGGKIILYPNIINDNERRKISSYMDECQIFRQYRTNGFKEPRVHVLLSSHANTGTNTQNESTDDIGPGYAYHGVKMKALPLKRVPPVEELASRLGIKFKLPNEDWNIGVDLLVYRDGRDKMGFHADDTQGEQLILSVVVETDERRVFKVRPKKHKHDNYKDGDENIELVVRQGDGYRMNAEMQKYYEHAVPPKLECKSKRKVLVFRCGQSRNCKDNGKTTSAEPIIGKKRIWYGQPSKETNVSIGSLHSRYDLSDSNVHDNILGGICGNRVDGCSSIIVSNKYSQRYEADFYKILHYSAPRHLAHSLITSYNNKYPIRVFRSSRCLKFAPYKKKNGSARYRYDGLYRIYNYFRARDCSGEDYYVFQFFLAQINPKLLYFHHDTFQLEAAVTMMELQKWQCDNL